MFKNDRWEGENVKVYGFNGIQEYEGGIKNEMKSGFGKLYYANDNLHYGGMWKEDKPAGNLVIIYDESGTKIYEGRSLNCYQEEYIYELEAEEYYDEVKVYNEKDGLYGDDEK